MNETSFPLGDGISVRARLRGLAAAAAVLLGLTLAACSGAVSSAPATPTQMQSGESGSVRRAASAVLGNPAGVYLGAWVNPSANGTQTPSPQAVVAQTAALEASMPRPLALHLHYFFWKDMKSLASNAEIADDVAHGRVPLISWHCADDLQKPALGLNDIAANPVVAADLTTIGRQLAALKAADGSPYPVMLRWFWEFNVNSAGGAGANANDNGGCFDTVKANYPSEFTTAWQTISATLASADPLGNVSLVWNPNVVNSVSGAAPYAAYYPGSPTVNWIGFDGYDKQNANGNPIGFSSVFSGDVTGVAVKNIALYGSKPLMLGETGSCNEYTDPNTQAEYLASAESTLESGSGAWPAVKALVYFDAPGSYVLADSQHCTYTLQTGLTAWNTLSADPYFAPMVAIP